MLDKNWLHSYCTGKEFHLKQMFMISVDSAVPGEDVSLSTSWDVCSQKQGYIRTPEVHHSYQ